MRPLRTGMLARATRVVPAKSWATARLAQTSVAGARTLRTTAAVRASEDSRPDLESSLPPGLEKLGESPEALTAINELMQLLKKNGIDVASGQKPTMAQIGKLAFDKEVRQCTAKGAYTLLALDSQPVVEELRNTGIELSPEKLQNLMHGGGEKK